MSDGRIDANAALRRQLRFSLFLQGFAALMMGGAAAIRVTSFGWDVLALILALAFVLILAVAIVTRRKLRELSSDG
jgi:hypothetical protein